MSGGSRDAFVDWYVKNAFDLAKEPIGCREFSLQWEAWQAALSHQAPAVAVSELEDLFNRIEWPPGETEWVILREDFDALINKAGSDE